MRKRGTLSTPRKDCENSQLVRSRDKSTPSISNKGSEPPETGDDCVARNESASGSVGKRRLQSNGAKILCSDEGEVRPVRVKRRKRVEKKTKSEAELQETLRGIQEGLKEGNEILQASAVRNRNESRENNDIELLKLIERGSPQFQALLEEVMARRKAESANTNSNDVSGMRSQACSTIDVDDNSRIDG